MGKGKICSDCQANFSDSCCDCFDYSNYKSPNIPEPEVMTRCSKRSDSSVSKRGYATVSPGGK